MREQLIDALIRENTVNKTKLAELQSLTQSLQE